MGGRKLQFSEKLNEVLTEQCYRKAQDMVYGQGYGGRYFGDYEADAVEEFANEIMEEAVNKLVIFLGLNL